ncbi:MAG: nitrous oxide reductase family maturation protein NosD [Gammaproteobacteria bacterium]|nr:nitrous oxide reductase family maturation protein NosD [Gammaproteobacteria bacterium]
MQFCLLMLAIVSNAYGRDWRVTPASLHDVMRRTVAGDRIVFTRGHYRANLVVDKPLSLQGEPGAVLDGGGQGDVLRIQAAGVQVSGLHLLGSGRNLTDMNAVIFIEHGARSAVIQDNQLDSDAFGIWVDKGRDVRILGNHIHGNPRIRSQDRGNGIHLFDTTGTLVADNEVWQTRDGIYIDTSNHNELRGNHLHDLRYGIHYMYSYYNKVVNNRTDHTRTGYALMQSKYLTVSGNRSDNDRNYGILMNYITNSTIADNVVTGVRPGLSGALAGEAVEGAEGKAIFIYNCQFNLIHDNVFADSDIGIHLTAGSEDNRIYGNAYIGNRVQVKYVATRPQEWSKDGRGNYWSDYLGWDLNADGIGDRPYEPVDGVDRLLWKYPMAKILMHSPAVSTLHWVQEQFPVLRPQGVKDSYPLMMAPAIAKGVS